MSEDLAIRIVGMVAIVSFIGYGLIRRNYPGHFWLTMVALWTAIIGTVWLVVDLVLRWRG